MDTLDRTNMNEIRNKNFKFKVKNYLRKVKNGLIFLGALVLLNEIAKTIM